MMPELPPFAKIERKSLPNVAVAPSGAEGEVEGMWQPAIPP